jgi:osmotically inducible protein OsmC
MDWGDGAARRPINYQGSGDMTGKLLYTAHANVVGGRNGHGETDDGALVVDLRRPLDMGGEGGGTNPEQLFAIGYAACFEGALGVAARRTQSEVSDARIAAAVSLHTDDDRGFVISVELDVTLPSVSDSQRAVELVRATHQICPYSNATRDNISVVLTANGQSVPADPAS